jgi:hypothetical protein
MDLVHYNAGENQIISIGADLFTFTLLRSENGFHFPVDAVDYLFGINSGYTRIFDNFEFGARLRISHISAHFADGHYDGKNNRWHDNRSPRVYSREFFEIMPYIKLKDLRIYLGYTYLYHVDPISIGKNNFQAGFEYYASEIIHEYITPFAAYDIKLVQIGKSSANNSLTFGIKFGNLNSRGLSIYYQYYSGKSLHGEYYDYHKKYSAFGMNLDL